MKKTPTLSPEEIARANRIDAERRRRNLAATRKYQKKEREARNAARQAQGLPIHLTPGRPAVSYTLAPAEGGELIAGDRTFLVNFFNHAIANLVVATLRAKKIENPDQPALWRTEHKDAADGVLYVITFTYNSANVFVVTPSEAA